MTTTEGTVNSKQSTVNSLGKFSQVVCVLVDVEFKSELPAIYAALTLELEGQVV